jgi:hypothetical protein
MEVFGSYSLALYCLPLIIGTVFSSWANIHIKLDSIYGASSKSRNRISGRKYLIFGIILSLLGALLDLSVVTTVPVTIRAGLASLSIPVSVLLARLILEEQMTFAQLIGVTFAIVGPFVSVVYANHDTSGRETDDWRVTLRSVSFRWFAIITGPVFVVSLHRLKFGTGHRPPSLFSLILCGFACAFTACLANSAARFLVFSASSKGLFSVESVVLFFLLLIISVGQIACMSSFLARYDASVALPMYQVINSMILSVWGVVVFGETIESVAGFVGGLSIAFLGLWAIATQGFARDEKCDEPLLDVSIEDRKYNTFYDENTG